MLIIRLQRVGKRNEPTFRVVLTDSKNGPKSGKFLEVLGSYDPRDKNITKIDGEKVTEWISKGAQVSDTVHNILINQGIVKGDKINVLPKKTPIVDEEAIAKAKEEAEKAEADAASAKEVEQAETEAPAEETPAEEALATEEAPAEVKTEEAPAEETPAPEVKEESPEATPEKEEAPTEEEKTEEVK